MYGPAQVQRLVRPKMLVVRAEHSAADRKADDERPHAAALADNVLLSEADLLGHLLGLLELARGDGVHDLAVLIRGDPSRSPPKFRRRVPPRRRDQP